MDCETQPISSFGNSPMVVRKVCTYMGFEDMKSIRLVSKLWSNVVSAHRDFDQNRLTVLRGSTNLYYPNNWMNDKISLPWAIVHIKNLHINHKRNFLKNLWYRKNVNVTQLSLHKIKISCADACRMLNNTPALTQVCFDNVQFNLHLGTNNNGVQRFISCNHASGLLGPEFDEITQTAVPTPTITKVQIKNQEAFPICILCNLTKRSQGMLADLTIRESPIPAKCFKRNFVRIPPNPPWNAVYSHILGLMNSSTESLKRLELDKIGFDFFGYLLNSVQQDNFKISELVFGTCLETTLLPNSNFNPTIGTNMIELVTRLSPISLESLRLNIAYHPGSQAAIRHMLTGLPKLQKLQIDIWSTATPPREFIHLQIPGACQLRELLVHSHPELPHNTTRNEQQHYEFLRTINTSKLESLSITSNRLTFRDPELNLYNALPNLLNQGKFGSLKKLCFWQGLIITNRMLQSIIRHIPALEELMIRNSTHLCNTGITGINRHECKRCKRGARNRTSGFSEHIIEMPGLNLSLLISLKRLDISGCVAISDFSLESGIIFPNLMEINLSGLKKITNAGLLSLVKNNPLMKKLVMHGKFLNVDETGMSAFISASPSIQEIEMSEPIAQSKTTQPAGDGPEQSENAKMMLKLRDLIKIKKSKNSAEH